MVIIIVNVILQLYQLHRRSEQTGRNRFAAPDAGVSGHGRRLNSGWQGEPVDVGPTNPTPRHRKQRDIENATREARPMVKGCEYRQITVTDIPKFLTMLIAISARYVPQAIFVDLQEKICKRGQRSRKAQREDGWTVPEWQDFRPRIKVSHPQLHRYRVFYFRQNLPRICKVSLDGVQMLYKFDCIKKVGKKNPVVS